MTLKTKMRYITKRVKSVGWHRVCPVCSRSSRVFASSAFHPRADARCLMCGSLERHRLAILFFRQQTDLFDGRYKRFLHVAPEREFVRMFAEAVGDGYLTADLAKRAMVKMDITDIQYPEDTFDIVYCSHVLEHVPDDRRAMSEFYSTLKPGGWAVLNVPISTSRTFEDPSVTVPEDRLQLFGQHNHVRRYGPDYQDRLVEAGFKVTRFSPKDVLADSEIEKFGLSNGAAGDIFYCTKS